jgi:hypothetical protein
MTLKWNFYTKKIDKSLNNLNPWILSTSRCNLDLKFIAASSKDNKSLICYIMKTFVYTSNVFFFFVNCNTKKKKHENPNNNYNLINKSWCLLTCCLNTIGNQQDILAIKIINYLLSLHNHIIDKWIRLHILV